MSCRTCGIDFIAKHYAECYCSKQCANKNMYKKSRLKQLNKGYQLKKQYGLSLEDFLALQEYQNSSCAICGKVTTKLYVDHCHTTGKVRGLLCMNCNTGLGHFKDNQTFLAKAIEYLEADIKKVRG